MIEKERMEELIKEGAVIYDIFRGDIYPVNLLSLIKLGDVGFEYHNDYYHCDICRALSDFYETREDAEWEQEFGRIIRTERLELPTWEEFKDKQLQDKFYMIDFRGKKSGSKYHLFITVDTNEIALYDIECIEYIFLEDATKENYTLACRKAKELFLGENK